MIEHIWSVLCSKSSIDSESNNISLIQVLEQVQVVADPLPPTGQRFLIPENCEFVTLWSRDSANQPIKGQARLTLLPPGDQTPMVSPLEYEIDLSTHERIRMKSRMPGLPIIGSGRYIFYLQYHEEGETTWRDAARIPLAVKVEPTSPSTG